MKLKIEREFVDKETGVLHKVGEVVEYAKERAEEILNHAGKFASKIEEKIEDKKPEAPTEPVLTDDNTDEDEPVLTDEELKAGAEEQAKMLLADNKKSKKKNK